MPKSNASASAASVSALTTSDVLRSYLASTVTYTSDDTLGDTALSVTVASSGIYKVELQILADIGAGGLRCDIGGTATITNFLVDTNVSNDSTWTPAGRYTTTSDIGIAGSFAADTASFYVTGSVEINAGGTFLLRGSQFLTNVASTSILRGSTLILTKMN